MARYADDLALAHVLADTADSISMSRFRSLDLHVTSKPDLTPVSDADTAVEKALRATLARTRPRDGVLGEEYGVTEAAAGPGGSRQWVIDPIDGTKNFIRGVPIWGTLIALMAGDEPVVGLASAPALGRRWWAARGAGAFADGTRLRVSKVARLEDAQLGHSSISSWTRHGLRDQFLELERRCWRGRGFGDFWTHMMVAEGAVDVAAEPEVSLWDVAAVQLIVEEAGGRFTDLAGLPRPDGGSAVSTNGLLHDEVLGILGA
jgi:histidinol-phosphatase